MAGELLAQMLVDNQNRPNEHTDMTVGIVVSSSPIEVKLENKLTLNNNQLVVPEFVRKKIATGDCTCGATCTVTIREGLKVGDKVILLKIKRGQQYLILSKG